MKAATQVIETLKSGALVITNDVQLDEIFRLAPDTSLVIRSVHNPAQIGAYDQYAAWIGEFHTQEEIAQKMREHGWYSCGAKEPIFLS